MAEAAALKRELGFRDLLLFSLAGIVGTRWLAAAAQTGPSSAILWLAAAAFFFVPSAFAIGRLSQRFPQQGGLYIWTRECFGPLHGFLCFWIYWIGLAFWFPSALMAYSSMAAYALGPRYVHLADNHGFVFSVSLLALWIALGTNLVGLSKAKWVDAAGTVAAYSLGAILLALGAAVFTIRGSATPLDFHPQWSWQTLNFWSQMAYALTGLELAPILAGEIRAPERNLPRAALVAAPVATLYYVLATLALLIILPVSGINPLHGLAQAVFQAGGMFGMPWLSPVVTALIALAALGQLSVLGACAARLPFAVGADRLLPSKLARLHPRWGTPHISILLFGCIATVFLVLTQLGDSLRAAYQTVTDLMAIAGFVPFVYIFLCAWRVGSRWSVAFGLSVTAVALLCAIVPTADVHSPWLFEAKLWGASAALVLSGWLIYSVRT